MSEKPGVIKVDPKRVRSLPAADREAIKAYVRGGNKAEFRYANVPEVRRILGLQTIEDLPANRGEIDGRLFHECPTCEQYLNENRDLRRENEALRKAAIKYYNEAPQEGDCALLLLSLSGTVKPEHEQMMETYNVARKGLRAVLEEGKT